MPKFNVVQKIRRTALAEMKRAKHGDPFTRKLKQKDNPAFPLHSISGKRKRKVFKKWRRDQKEALAKGLITMEDVEMAVADGQLQGGSSNSKDAAKSSPRKFRMKKAARIKSMKRDKKRKSSGGDRVAEASSPAAMEE